jgi:hypothetical protein
VRTDATGLTDSTAGADANLEAWLAAFADRLDLDRERRREVVDEIRSHVLDAAADYRAHGLDCAGSLRCAWAKLGPEDEVAAAINAAHAGSGLSDAVWLAGLPVLLALVLRWGILTFDGRTVDWSRLALTVPFVLFAATTLVAPLVSLPRRRFAAAAWACFWVLSVLVLAAG